MGYRLSIELTDGRVYSFRTAKMPRHWKSWLMHQVPYGADFRGARFNREAI